MLSAGAMVRVPDAGEQREKHPAVILETVFELGYVVLPGTGSRFPGREAKIIERGSRYAKSMALTKQTFFYFDSVEAFVEGVTEGWPGTCPGELLDLFVARLRAPIVAAAREIRQRQRGSQLDRRQDELAENLIPRIEGSLPPAPAESFEL